MADLRDIVRFSSSRFVPVLPEAAQVNPGIYGAELSFWLCSELAKRGVVTSYPNYEDWGWFIEYATADGAEFAVHCANVYGHDDQWLLSLRRHGRKIFGRDKPSYSDAGPVIEAIRRTVEADASISQIEWLYASEDAV